MDKFSTAQQPVANVVPNNTSRAADILSVFQGSSGAANAANSGLFGAGSLFDNELGQASTREVSTDHHKDADASNAAADIRPDKNVDPDQRDQADYEEQGLPQGDDHDHVAAPRENEHSERRDHPDATNNQANAVDEVADGQGAVANDANASPAAEEPIGTAEDLLSQAEKLLAQIQEFALANPELAGQLQAILAPITQSLEQVITQLNALSPDSLITASQLGGNPANAFARLEQLASLFNKLQSGQSLGAQADSSLASAEGQELPEGLLQAAKALQKAGGDVVAKVNEFAAAFKAFTNGKPQQVVDTNNLGQSTQAVNQAGPQTKQIDVSQLVKGIIASDQATTVAEAKVDSAAQLKVAGQNIQVQANDNQSGAGGGANHQSQQQAFAQAQSQELAAQAAKTGVGAARPEGATSSNTSTAHATNTSAGAHTTTATLSKEAANFERLLKQANQPSASEQIRIQMKAMIKNGRSAMVVKLDPPELGQLEIKMQVSKVGKADMIINVERPATLELLQRDSRLLTNALQDAGLKTDSGSLSFNLQGGNDSQGGDDSSQPKNIYPIAEEQFDEEIVSAELETHTLAIEQGVNIHA